MKNIQLIKVGVDTPTYTPTEQEHNKSTPTIKLGGLDKKIEKSAEPGEKKCRITTAEYSNYKYYSEQCQQHHWAVNNMKVKVFSCQKVEFR